jgi:hypothetical protein
MPEWHGHGWSWSQYSWYDACGCFLWGFLQDTVYTTIELQQVMCAVLTRVSKVL